ncbi:MAG: hypothetical protein N3C63_01890 [Rhodocyclaceae bacterium]|nr:hypothetical protein [Rhodocyclaceae bacterium]
MTTLVEEAEAGLAHDAVRAIVARAEGVPAGGDRYRFRHVLLRDAAYASLTQADRRATHRRVVEILRAHFPQRLRLDPAEAARHLAAAGATRR